MTSSLHTPPIWFFRTTCLFVLLCCGSTFTLAAEEPCVPSEPYNQCVAITYEGVDQIFVAPAQAEYLIKVWGAGGGGNWWWGMTGFRGGGGAYVEGKMLLSSSTALNLIVGEGGLFASGSGRPAHNITPRTYGGGGAGGFGYYNGGSGGGRSAVQIDLDGNGTIEPFEEELMTAAGGGGLSSGTYQQPLYAGNGGVLEGEAAHGLHCITDMCGDGGTQSAGGRGGKAIVEGYSKGEPGSFLRGGDAGTWQGGPQGDIPLSSWANFEGGGGGGGGWYGGGGGAGRSCCGGGDGPGGGGSSHVTEDSSLITDVVMESGRSPGSPGRASDVHRRAISAHIGRGGYQSKPLEGGHGLIVIQWYQPDSDFGDAPPSYQGASEASHEVSELMLGATVTVESSGQPSSFAHLDQDDGVMFADPMVGEEYNAITLNSSGNGFASMWIDFDHDGSFDASDQILSSEPVQEGDNAFCVYLPKNSNDSTTYARVRLAEAPINSPEGFARGGEVEDYALVIYENTPEIMGVVETCQ